MTVPRAKTIEELKAMTLIEEKMIASGRMFKWFAAELDYAVNSGSTTFLTVYKGRKVPTAARRLRLAQLLHTKPSALWRLDDATGGLVARRIGDRML